MSIAKSTPFASDHGILFANILEFVVIYLAQLVGRVANSM